MSLRKTCCLVASGLFMSLFGQGTVQGGPLLDKIHYPWWDKHFEGSTYSPLHYWLPGIYRCHAYHHPRAFEAIQDAPPAAPVPDARGLPTPQPVPNGVEPIGPPGRPVNPGN